MVNYIICLLTVLLTIQNVFSQCNEYTCKTYLDRSVYRFTTGLMSRINQETESHFIASGLSAWGLLSTISFGAAETTLTEIKEVLKLHPHTCFNNKYFEILRNVGKNDGGVLERSSVIFVDASMKVHDKFKENVQSTGLSEVTELPWNNYIETASAINDHVRSATHEAIDEIISASELPGVLLVLIDALYFKGGWRVQFPYENTEVSPFYNNKGAQIGQVNMMFASAKFNTTFVDQIGAKVIELPYGDDNRYSMLIYLPYASSTVTSVIENLKRVSLNALFKLFRNREPREVMVQIPRFKIDSDIINLKELLADMGLKLMFDSARANFQEISDYQLYVSNLIQKAHIEVTEEGTVAAAVSEAVFEARMLPDQFVANKPFFFMIVDRVLQLPIFTGAYSKPTIY